MVSGAQPIASSGGAPLEPWAARLHTLPSTVPRRPLQMQLSRPDLLSAQPPCPPPSAAHLDAGVQVGLSQGAAVHGLVAHAAVEGALGSGVAAGGPACRGGHEGDGWGGQSAGRMVAIMQACPAVRPRLPRPSITCRQASRRAACDRRLPAAPFAGPSLAAHRRCGRPWPAWCTPAQSQTGAPPPSPCR